MIKVAATFGAPMFLIFSGISYFNYANGILAAISATGAALSVLALIIISITALINLSANILVGAITIQVFGEMLLSGGLSAASTPLAILVVPASILLCDRRAIIPWTIVTGVLLILVTWLDSNGALPPIRLSQSDYRIDQLLSILMGLFSVAFLTNRFSLQAQTALDSLAQERAQFKYEALHDSLTGLPNRSQFSERASETLTTCLEKGRSCTLLYVDLNGFKQINDTLGHSAGDELLKAFSRRMKNRFGADDLVARLSGDEFVLLTGNHGKDGTEQKLIERVTTAMIEPFYISGQTKQITASVGSAVYPRDAECLDQLLRLADHSMYEAKARSKRQQRTANIIPLHPVPRTSPLPL